MAAAESAWQQSAGWAAPQPQAEDRRLRAPWALALLRLGEIELATPVIEELHGEGFCEPWYRDLCPETVDPLAEHSLAEHPSAEDLVLQR